MVTLVCNRNSTAYSRGKQFNFKWYPSFFQDGGYQVNVGSSSYAISNSLAYTEKRSVHPLDLKLQMYWQGGGKIGVKTWITNQASSTFSGWVRVYVVEKASTQGWNDTGNIPYTNAFLAYAINQNINLKGNTTLTLNSTWSAPSAGYYNLTYGNTKLVAGVFTNTYKIAYADPPRGNQFYAYYAETSTEAEPQPLGSSTDTISAQFGGSVDFHCCGYTAKANNPYLFLGSITGTTPGLPLAGNVILPLNIDAFSSLLITMVNTPTCSNFAGKLNQNGYAKATLTLPALPGSIGLAMDFAWFNYSTFNFASNPVRVTLN